MAGPYKRRFSSRGKFRRIRRYGGRRRGYGRRTKGFIKSVVRRMSEAKWSTKTFGAVTSANAGIGQELTPAFTQGAGKESRIGNSIRSKYFQVRGFIQLTFSGAVTNLTTMIANVRVIIFSMRSNPSGASLPTFQDIFDIATSSTWSTSNIWSSIRNNNIIVHYDKTRTMSPYTPGTTSLPTIGTSSTGYAPTWLLKVKKRFVRNIAFRDSSVTAPTDPQDRIFLVCVTDIPSANTDLNLLWQYTSRLSFTDV